MPDQNPDDAYLHDWMFHYNVFTACWAAIPRDLYQAYWSDYNHPGILRSSSKETLLTILHRTKGDADAIEQLIRPS